MKKLMAMVLACCLLLGSAALAESPAEESVKLTYEELQMYMTALREDALKEGSVSIISSQDGPTMAVTAVGNLTIADEQLTQTTAVVGAQLAAGVSIDDIRYESSSRYTSQVLLGAIAQAIDKAR